MRFFCTATHRHWRASLSFLFLLTATFKPPISMTTVFSFEAFPDFTPVMSPPRIHTHAFAACMQGGELTAATLLSCFWVTTGAVSLLKPRAELSMNCPWGMIRARGHILMRTSISFQLQKCCSFSSHPTTTLALLN